MDRNTAWTLPQKSNGDEVSWDTADSVVEGVRNFHIDEQLTAEK